jgi:hypothetical protein
VSLAEAAGVTLRRTGSDLTGCCPFHEDGTPSLVISPEKNLWHSGLAVAGTAARRRRRGLGSAPARERPRGSRLPGSGQFPAFPR